MHAALRPIEGYENTRSKLRLQLYDGKLDTRTVEIEVKDKSTVPIGVISNIGGMEQIQDQLQEMLGGMFPAKKKRRMVKVPEARELLIQEEAQKLIDMEAVVKEAIAKTEQNGIIFLDEIDKIAGRERSLGPDVSREGVQRDLLPIVEGSTVTTKYGPVKTDHILFIAAGAFHVAKPSDLIPELQGRFPIRVELSPLTKEDFIRILTEPQNALIKQYTGAPRDGRDYAGFHRRRARGNRGHCSPGERTFREYRRPTVVYHHGTAPRRNLL